MNSVFENIRKEWIDSHISNKLDESTKQDEILHQGKTLDQWCKDFKGEFTKDQLLQMIRGEADLQKILLCGLDESDNKDIDDPVFNGEEFFNEKACAESDEVDPELDESTRPEDVATVGDLILLLKTHDPKDQVMFRADKQEYSLVDVQSKDGVTVLDFAKGKYNESENDSVAETDNIDERRYGGYSDGGYAGTGKSYSKLSHDGGHVPRGKEIDWYNVSDLDPKAKGKANGWRCGPANFPFVDELYNNRRYHKFTMMLRHPGFGGSGHIQIAIPSYFAAIKNNDNVALDLLHKLGLPLDLTFGMNPDDDYSSQYDIIN